MTTSEPQRSSQTKPAPQRRPRPGGIAPQPKKSTKNTKLTISVNNELAEELRDAVVWLQQQGHRTTLTSLLITSVTNRLNELKAELDGPIPHRDEQWARLVPGALPGEPSPQA